MDEMGRKVRFTYLFLVVFFLAAAAPSSEAAGCKDVSPFMERAEQYVGEGMYAKAEPLLRQAGERCPGSANIRYDLAVALYGQGKSRAAAKALDRALKKDPDHIESMKLLAYILIMEDIDKGRGRLVTEALLDKVPEDMAVKKLWMLVLAYEPPASPKSAYGDRKAVKGSKKTGKARAAAVPFVDRNIPVTGINNPDAVAVVIGVRNYKNRDIPTADYAFNDAFIVKKYLVRVLGYSEKNIIFEPDASKATFESIFGNSESYDGILYNYLKKGRSHIFVYYSGHGAPDIRSRQGYFVPSDANPNAIKFTGYPLKLFYENLAKIAKAKKSPKVTVAIDSCFSGSYDGGMILKNVSPIMIEVDNPLIAMHYLIVMRSSSGAEVSSWYPEKMHSMFTYFFLKGLNEMARAGGSIRAGDVFDVIIDENEGVPYYARRLGGRVQTPQFIGDKDRPILKR